MSRPSVDGQCSPPCCSPQPGAEPRRAATPQLAAGACAASRCALVCSQVSRPTTVPGTHPALTPAQLGRAARRRQRHGLLHAQPLVADARSQHDNVKHTRARPCRRRHLAAVLFGHAAPLRRRHHCRLRNRRRCRQGEPGGAGGWKYEAGRTGIFSGRPNVAAAVGAAVAAAAAAGFPAGRVAVLSCGPAALVEAARAGAAAYGAHHHSETFLL